MHIVFTIDFCLSFEFKFCFASGNAFSLLSVEDAKLIILLVKKINGKIFFLFVYKNNMLN